MTKIRLNAVPGHFNGDAQSRSIMLAITESLGATFAEAKTLQDVKDAVAAFGARVSTETGGISFLVFVTVAAGQRKMAAFDKANSGRGAALGCDAWMQFMPDGAEIETQPRTEVRALVSAID